MRSITTVILVLALAAPAAAQDAAATKASPLADSNRALFGMVKGYIAAAAEQMPEEHYAFRPSPEVRSFGELIGHIANAHYGFCSGVLGEANPRTEDYEKARTTKAGLVEALRESIEYCDRAYAEVDDARLGEPVSVFGQARNRLFALVFNIAHDNEHYGNIVTYMRMKGLVPPSSQPRT